MKTYEYSTVPEYVQSGMREHGSVDEAVVQAYGDFIMSGEFELQHTPQSPQQLIVGFRPIIFNNGGLETQAVTLSLNPESDFSSVDRSLLYPKPVETDPLRVALNNITLLSLEDGSSSSLSSIARRTDSGLIGGIALGFETESKQFTLSRFWHENFGKAMISEISELCDLVEEELQQSDEVFTAQEMAAVGVFKLLEQKILQEPDSAKVNLLAGLLTLATELGPIARISYGGRNTLPHPKRQT